MRLAFDEDRRIFAAEIEPVGLLGFPDADRNGEVLRQRDALFREELPRRAFKIVSSVRIAGCADPLKVIDFHAVYPVFVARLE
jgi:hypothetical protein